MREAVARMYDEDELLPLSALQHMVFCERQAALIHVEQQWNDNALTIEGSHLHRVIDDEAPLREVRGDLVILRRVPLRCLALGLVGRSDVVELHRCGDELSSGRPDSSLRAAVTIRGLEGAWVPYPVETKRGRPKKNACDEVQLCAQALCLEEMLGVAVPRGALFYGKRRRRHAVEFSPELRLQTREAAQRFRKLVATGTTPRTNRSPKCERCSFLERCLPDAMGEDDRVAAYMRRMVEEDSDAEEFDE